MKIEFEEVKVTGSRIINGRRQQRTFTATINPFNKNADGFPKSRDEVRRDLEAQRSAWQQEQK